MAEGLGRARGCEQTFTQTHLCRGGDHLPRRADIRWSRRYIRAAFAPSLLRPRSGGGTSAASAQIRRSAHAARRCHQPKAPSIRLGEAGETLTPFSPYIAPRLPHMSEINSFFPFFSARAAWGGCGGHSNEASLTHTHVYSMRHSYLPPFSTAHSSRPCFTMDHRLLVSLLCSLLLITAILFLQSYAQVERQQARRRCAPRATWERSPELVRGGHSRVGGGQSRAGGAQSWVRGGQSRAGGGQSWVRGGQ